MSLRFYLFFLAGVLSLFGCSQQPDQKSVFADGDLMLLYMESEPGVDPYQSRLLLNNDFMRMDDGTDDSDFTLFDRNKHIIYSVTHGERGILNIGQMKSNNTIHRKLVLDANKLHEKGVPKVEGKTPVQYRLMVNNRHCATIYAVKGLHPEVVKALREFRRILASVHLSKLKNTPPEMRDECFLAHDIKVPNRILQYGLPVYEASVSGSKRILVDYKSAVKHKPELFILPKGYQTRTLSGKPGAR